jgi:DNA polymerase alpha subunit A
LNIIFILNFFFFFFNFSRKGIDIVRRDWSEITRRVGREVLEMVLDEKKDKENLAEEIYFHMENLNKGLALLEHSQLAEFIITKMLSKDPS